MTDLIWVISSSVMIIAVMILRAVFGKRIKSGVRMILWGLVLLRLLIPGTFLESPTSFASVASKIETVDTFDALKNIERVDYHEPFKAIEFYPENSSEESFFRDGVSSKKFERVDKTLGVKKVLTYVWYAGAAATALIFLVTNLSLFVRLKRRRRMIEADCPLRVYVVENIDSPFLFGRSIYVDKATSEDGELLRYVLAHEMSHHRHVDQLTSILRFAAVSIHWYNPLVWVAAELSRRDADLFADDEAIRSLGDGERENYGKVLIGLSSVAKRPTILNGATMMTGGKSALFFRIKRIAKNTKTSFAVILAVITLSLTALGLAFIGRAEDGLIADKEHETIKIGIKDDGHLDLPDKDLIDSIDILYLDGCLGSTDGVDGGTEAADEIYSALDNITVDTSSVTTHKRQLIEGGYGLTVKIFLKDRTTYTVSFSYDKFPGPSTEEYYSEYKTTGYERLKNAVNKLKNIIITPDQTEPEFRFTVVGRNGYEVKFSVIDNNMNLLYSTSAESGAVDFTLDTDQKELLYSYINDIKSVSKNAEYERPDFKAFTNSRLYTEVTYEFGEYSFTTFYELTDNAAVKESMRFFSDFLPESAFRHSDNDSVGLPHGEEHFEVMGLETTVYIVEEHAGWCTRTYVAKDSNGEPFICGISCGFDDIWFTAGSYAYAYSKDFAVDLDGDGTTELVCNRTSGGDTHTDVCVFKNDNGVIRCYRIKYEELDLEGWYNNGIASWMSVYDPNTNAIHVKYWRVDEGKDINDGEYCDRIIDLSEMVEVKNWS